MNASPERVAWLSPRLAAALSGFVACGTSLLIEVPLLRVIALKLPEVPEAQAAVVQGQASALALTMLALFVAPWLEELAKRLCMWPLRARWGGTGLAFGVLEALIKLLGGLQWQLLNGALASVLLHWGLGRVAERARLGLLWAILLHAVFNWAVLFGTGWVGLWFQALAPVFAGVLLGLSFLRRWRRVDGAAGAA